MIKSWTKEGTLNTIYMVSEDVSLIRLLKKTPTPFYVTMVEDLVSQEGSKVSETY